MPCPVGPFGISQDGKDYVEISEKDILNAVALAGDSAEEDGCHEDVSG